MNQTEKLATLEALQDAVLIKLADADPEGETFETLLTHYERLNYLIPRQGADIRCTTCAAPVPCTRDFVAPYDAPVAIDEDPGTPGENPTEAEAEPEPVTTPESTALPSLGDMKVRLARLANTGKDVRGALESLGAKRLSDLPPEKYEALMAALGEEL